MFNRQFAIARRSFMRGAVAALTLAAFSRLTGARPVDAQTVAPPPVVDPVIAPPPGAVRVDPAPLDVAPEGVPPVVGLGALMAVPANAEGATAVISADLGDGGKITLLIPTDPTIERVARVQVGVAGPSPDAAASFVPVAGMRFDLNIYEGGAPLGVFPDGSIAGVLLNPTIDPTLVACARYDETADAAEPIGLTPGEAPMVTTFPLAGVGTYLLGASA